MRRSAIVGAITGGLFPFCYWIANAFFGYVAGPETFILWPGSIMLLSLETQQNLPFATALWIGCALINIALYTALALCVFALYRLVSTKGRADARPINPGRTQMRR